MTSNDIRKALNEFITLYPNVYRGYNQVQLDKVAESWERKYGDLQDYEAFIEALYNFETNSEYSSPPTTKQWRSEYKNTKNRLDSKKGKSVRRIETPEEVMANLFHQEMAKPHNKRNYDLLERTKYYAGLFQDDEIYKKHFGKSREEFERI